MKALLHTVYLIALCSLLSPAQQPGTPAQAQPETPTIRTSTRLVTVDVVVTENGHTVQGLGKDAFRILENGKEQETRNFDVHAYIASPPARPSAPAAQKSAPAMPAHVYSNAVVATGPPSVLLLDALNTPVKDQQFLRKQMVSYLKEIPAGTRIAIFGLGTRLRMIQGFTSDISTLMAAMDARKNGVNNSVLIQQQSDFASDMEDSDDSTALDVLDQFQGEIVAAQYDLRIATTLDAMKQLGAFLGGLPGRKNIIWLSGSFPLSLQPDESAENPFISQRNYSKQLQDIADSFTADRIAVYPVDVRGTLPPAMFDAAGSSLNSTAAPRRRAGRGAQPIATASTQDFDQLDAEHSTMRQLAEETGGRAFYETNGLKEAIARAMEDGANYYTLTYSPQNKDFNGKFRKIEIKLTSGKYHLSYRRGYYAQQVSIAAKVNEPDPLISPNHPALQHGAPSARQIVFKARVLPADDPALKDFQPKPGPAGMVSVKPPTTRYCVDYALHTEDINAQLGSDHLYHSAVELLAIAYDPDGKPVNLVDHPFQFTLRPEEYEKLVHSGLNLREEIDIPQGEVYLRLAVHDLFNDQLGSLEVPVGMEQKKK